MKIVIIGGTGLIGSKVAAILRDAGHQVVAAAPDTGVNTITGEGLEPALRGAEVVIDLANGPSFEAAAISEFFRTHETNLLAAEARAGVKLHVLLSIVGSDRMPDNGYFRAKLAQEAMVAGSGIAYTIIRSTQFMEFLGAIADAGERDGAVHIATGMFQPIAADDVAAIVSEAAVSAPRHGMTEIAGPDRAPFHEIVQTYLARIGDSRRVEADPGAEYFGGRVEELSLVPLGDARIGQVTLSDWIQRKLASEEHR